MCPLKVKEYFQGAYFYAEFSAFNSSQMFAYTSILLLTDGMTLIYIN